MELAPMFQTISKEKWKALFRVNRLYIVQSLDITGILDFMLGNFIIGQCQYEELLNLQERGERSRLTSRILDHLNRRPACDFYKMLEFFANSNQQHIIEKLHEKLTGQTPGGQTLMTAFSPAPHRSTEPHPLTEEGAVGPSVDIRLFNITDEEGDDNGRNCIICLTKQPKVIFLDCGHANFCKSCAVAVLTRNQQCLSTVPVNCPSCRKFIRKAQPMY